MDSGTGFAYNSIDSLIREVEEFQTIYQLETIDRLTVENSLLWQLIEYHKRSARIMALLERCQKALALLQQALENCTNEKIAAERDWLAFWGVQKDYTKLPKYTPGGWI